jgi:hypothetical protein
MKKSYFIILLLVVMPCVGMESNVSSNGKSKDQVEKSRKELLKEDIEIVREELKPYLEMYNAHGENRDNQLMVAAGVGVLQKLIKTYNECRGKDAAFAYKRRLDEKIAQEAKEKERQLKRLSWIKN